MNALDAFLSTWGRARSMFGEGTPHDGSVFDKSAQLRELQGTVQSAGPGAHWEGAASADYADTNTQHAARLGQIAELDERLGAEITRSAEVVLAGRRDLDALKQWVTDTAGHATTAADRTLWSTISKASSDMAEIVERSHHELASVARRIAALGDEFESLRRP
ncbi:uncharacterized protein YukE [Mycobacterium sp. MAA66]|uniref:EspA/EspE family type VII secretion system effector n=1 Tax=Mycobacterium sp. MAA66 TaxID=3156297 RepID=UPI003518653B